MWYTFDAPNGISWVELPLSDYCFFVSEQISDLVVGFYPIFGYSRVLTWFIWCPKLDSRCIKSLVIVENASISMVVIRPNFCVLWFKWTRNHQIQWDWHLSKQLVCISGSCTSSTSNRYSKHSGAGCSQRIWKHYMHTGNISKGDFWSSKRSTLSLVPLYYIFQVVNGGFSYFMILQQFLKWKTSAKQRKLMEFMRTKETTTENLSHSA